MENMLVTSVYSFTSNALMMYVSVKTFSVRATGYFSSMISWPTEMHQSIMELVKQAEPNWWHGLHHRKSLSAWR
jgi:hypothetical protein